jgi:hypothetical protein
LLRCSSLSIQTSARGAEIASVPTTVNHPRGVLLFVADEDVEGVEVEQRELRFRWLSPVANSSHTGVFTITKVRVNRAPKVEEPEVQILGSGVMRIKLKGEDSDSGPTVPGTGLFYKVVRGPLFGRLYQVETPSSLAPVDRLCSAAGDTKLLLVLNFISGSW